MTQTMTGKVALVTGAGDGLGRASAIVFAREGAQVVVSDIDETGGTETVSLIREAGGEATFVSCATSPASSRSTPLLPRLSTSTAASTALTTTPAAVEDWAGP